MGKINVLSGSGRVVLPAGGERSDDGERSWVGDKIKVPVAHSEVRKSFILTAVTLLLLPCDAPLSPIGISKLLEFLLLVLFKDGSWFVEMATVGDGRTELHVVWAWVEGIVKMEDLGTSTECAAEDTMGGCDGGEGLVATNFWPKVIL